MRNIIHILLLAAAFFAFPGHLQAQEHEQTGSMPKPIYDSPTADSLERSYHSYRMPMPADFTQTDALAPSAATDTVTQADHRFAYPMTGFADYACDPYYFNTWPHTGLNVNIDLAAIAQFGQHGRYRSGFGQRLSLAYLQPINKRLQLTIGGFLSHLRLGEANCSNGGIYGQLEYRFNPHWSAYVYGQKAIVQNKVPYGFYYGHAPFFRNSGLYGYMGDRLGVAVRWSPHPSMYFEVSVERNDYPAMLPSTSFDYLNDSRLYR